MESNAQKKVDLDAGSVSSTLSIVDTIPTALVLHYKTITNTDVKVYEHVGDTIICDLTIPVAGLRSCDISYWINANSVNGTVEVQTVGTITVYSECLTIKTITDLLT